VLRALITIAVVLAVTTGGASAKSEGGTPAVFVSVERASQLVGVDLTTGRVIARIRVPAGPHNVTSYSARYVLVTSPPAGAVTLVDAFTRRILKVWRGFGSPHDVEVDRTFAYVTDEGRGQLVVIDLATRGIVARVRVPARPHDVAVGDVAIVTHASGRDLTVVDLRRPGSPRLTLWSLFAGGPAHDISEQHDSANAYVTYWDSGSVGAVDWGNKRVLWRKTVGALVHHVQFDGYHGRRVWATDHRTGEVLALSSRDGRVLRRLHGCSGAHHLAVVGTAWVGAACNDADALAIWNQSTWKRRLVRVGDGPHSVAEVVLP
jgi:DNA-binding beta-propeller fold protein YncE